MVTLPSDKVCLITGASRGIGEGIARRLAHGKYRIAVTGRSLDDLARVAKDTGAISFACDLTDGSSLARTVQQIEATMGPIDVLINNAGLAESVSLADTTDDIWQRTFDLNVTAAFRLCRAIVPTMASRGWGRVVNVASNAGLRGYSYTSAYCASKHAVVGLTRALAVEFARSGVTINAVCPGFVDTDMTQRSIARIAATTGRTAAQARTALEALSPQRRLMTVEEVAHAVAALIDDEAQGIHGQAIALDGGQSA
jgi:3-hydroxybutyrate dehydrogenase